MVAAIAWAASMPRVVSPSSQRSSPANHAGGAHASHHAFASNAPAVAGRRVTSGNASTRPPITTIRTAPENASRRLRDASSTSRPWMATIPIAANRLAARLDAANATAARTTEPVLAAPIRVSAASGSSPRWDPTTNRPPKSRSAASFAANTTERDSGSAMRMRKSVSSGNSDWPTSDMAPATIHIGRAIRNAWSATTSLR